MHVTHISPTAFGADGLFGGGERYPLELCRALARYVSCRLVTFGASARRVREASGLEIVVLPTRLTLKRHPAHPLAPLHPRLLSGDVLHAHQMRAAPSRLAAVFATVSRTPIAVTDHGLGGGGWAGLLPKMFDLFLTVSRSSAECLGAPPQRTRIVYGGCDPQRFTPQTWGKRRGVLFVGRLTPHKGIDRLIRALPTGVPLTIVGTTGHDRHAPERDYPALLRRLARGKDVTFRTDVGDEELARLYRSTRACVLPSVRRTCYGKEVAISELLGLAAIESMMSGTPVVASRIGGLAEVVEHGVTGYLVEPGDEGALRGALDRVLSDDTAARAMGRAARALALERFTWDACARRCLEGYEELTGAL